MGIFKNLFGMRDIKSPEFYKDFKEENKELSYLLDLKDKVKSNKIKYIERDIEFLKDIIEGEKNVYSKLKNSSAPMICLHDIKIKYGDYIAQLDFILITTKFIMILETKKLNGDISINEEGDFVRYIKSKDGKIIDIEDVDSPIAQNDRNVRVVREVLIEEKLIKTLPILSAVIIANEKTTVNRSKAKKKIKYEIFAYDELTELINRKLSCYSKDKKMFDDQMKKIAEYFISNNKEIQYDYYKKYDLNELDFIEEKLEEKSIIEHVKEVEEIEGIDSEALNKVKSYEELIVDFEKYRENKSKEENIRPYFIYNDDMINEIIELNPSDKKELIEIKGFGPTKIDKYGQDIIDILRGYTIFKK